MNKLVFGFQIQGKWYLACQVNPRGFVYLWDASTTGLPRQDFWRQYDDLKNLPEEITFSSFRSLLEVERFVDTAIQMGGFQWQWEGEKILVFGHDHPDRGWIFICFQNQQPLAYAGVKPNSKNEATWCSSDDIDHSAVSLSSLEHAQRLVQSLASWNNWVWGGEWREPIT